MVNTEIISEWLKKADEDFQFALVNLKEKNLFMLRFVSIFIRLLKNI